MRDSNLIIKWEKGKNMTVNLLLIQIMHIVKWGRNKFTNVFLNHVLGEVNEEADKLSKEDLLLQEGFLHEVETNKEGALLENIQTLY
jgi:hypothetical protein